jgi:hypothetical protein
LPPSVGSGLRAVTFDPSPSPSDPLPIPKIGDIYAFTPNGLIDAGEAGIAGGKVTLGANQVLNANNISFSNGSVGVPSASGGSVSLGALNGVGNVTDTTKLMEQTAGLGGARDKSSLAQANTVDDFMSKFLDVKIIGFDTDEGLIGKKDKDKEKEKEKN